jgi:hypothetical protein
MPSGRLCPELIFFQMEEQATCFVVALLAFLVLFSEV